MQRACDYPACVDGFLCVRVIDYHRRATCWIWERCPLCEGAGVFDEGAVERRGLSEVDGLPEAGEDPT